MVKAALAFDLIIRHLAKLFRGARKQHATGLGHQLRLLSLVGHTLQERTIGNLVTSYQGRMIIDARRRPLLIGHRQARHRRLRAQIIVNRVVAIVIATQQGGILLIHLMLLLMLLSHALIIIRCSVLLLLLMI